MKLSSRWFVYGSLVVASTVVLAGLTLTALWRAPSSSVVVPAAHNLPPKVDGMPLPDVAEGKAHDDPVALSKWLDTRAKRYRGLFKDWQCDVLILPVQVEGFGFDAPTRQLMAGDVAMQLRQTDRCVTDPYQVDLALGEGVRRRSPEAVRLLARELKAKVIVSTFAGHDRYDRMRITMIVEKLANENASGAKALVAHSVDNLKYGGDTSPFEVFHRSLPALLSSVGLQGQAQAAQTAGTLPAKLPGSPEDLMRSDDTSPIAQAVRLVLLGILAPNLESRAAERLFTKAWLVLANVDDSDPAVQRMRARILFHLFERPFALAKIKSIDGPEANGLRAVLNGNLDEAQTALKEVKEPWERLFLMFEVNDLATIYSRKDDETVAELTAALGPSWAALIEPCVCTWRVPNLLDSKRLLDRVFPVEGQSLNDVVRGSAVIAQFDDPSTYDLLALKHVHLLLEQDPHKWCCSSFDPSPTRREVLDLFDSRIEFDLIEHVRYLLDTQGLPAQALVQLEKYDSELAGQPVAEGVRARIDLALIANGSASNQQSLRAHAMAAARTAEIVEQGQYAAAQTALWILGQTTGIGSAIDLGRSYTDDYPVRPSWLSAETPQYNIEFSSNEIRPLQLLAGYPSDKKKRELQAVLEHRFLGSPIAAELRLHRPGADVDDDSALRAAIQQDPENWNLYSTLADVYIKRSEYADASTVALSFPDFKKSTKGNTVALSNQAFSVGVKLYNLGATDAARPLLKIAADFDNGSSSNIQARAAIALLDGKYSEAAMGYLQSARRYTDLNDYRDYLSMLFAGGFSRDAWAGFNQLVRRNMGPDPWVSAMVGHRLDNISAIALRQWLNDSANGRDPPKDREALVNYALMAQIQDRGVPPDDIEEFITTFAGPSNVIVKYGRFEGSVGNEPVHPWGPSKLTYHLKTYVFSKTPRYADNFVVPNRYALFAKAYLALRKDQFAESARAFEELASFYDIESMKEWGFALPYFALAVAQSGDKIELEKYLDSDDSRPEEWGNYLAKAVFKGLRGEHEKALKWLDMALHGRPKPDYWPLTTAYEYADVCTTLFEKTHDERYRQKALDWARVRAKIQPTEAWAHALIARLGEDQSERVSEMAMAQYLDPQSAWAKQAPAALHDSAAAWLKAHPPFKMEKHEDSSRAL